MRGLIAAGMALAVGASLSAVQAKATNFYVGVEGGYRMSDFDVKIPAYAPPAGDFGVQPNGFMWGGFAAMTYDLGDKIEFGFQIEGFDFEATSSNPTGLGAEQYFVRENYNLALSAIVMVDLDTGLKGFVSAGYGLSQADAIYSTTPGLWRTADFAGLVAGIGITKDISNNFFFRAQYRYSDLGSDTVVHVGGSSLDMTSHDVTAGVGLSF
jgi:opacity protein-like surface antigen